MCLIALAWNHHANYELVVAANRDEFHKRQTAAADFWPDSPNVLAGRDLEQGGSWLGLSTTGRFAGITNARGTIVPNPDAPSRGWLIRDFLQGEQSARDFAEGLLDEIDRYAGFNLFLADREHLIYLSNVTEPAVRELQPGRYVLSNGHLDSDWPKMQRAGAALDDAMGSPDVSVDDLLSLLTDSTPAMDAELPDTGVGTDMERLLSPIFITSPVYGTRCSTAITVRQGNVNFHERRFDPDGNNTGDSSFELEWHTAND